MDVTFTASEIADACLKEGLEPPELTEDEKSILREFVQPVVGQAAVTILGIGLQVVHCARDLIGKMKNDG